jgi:hypothetical protein
MFVEPATGHSDIRCRENEERRFVFLCHFRSAEKRLLVLCAYIAVLCSVLCDTLVCFKCFPF